MQVTYARSMLGADAREEPVAVVDVARAELEEFTADVTPIDPVVGSAADVEFLAADGLPRLVRHLLVKEGQDNAECLISGHG